MEGSPGRNRLIIPRWRALSRTPSIELESACEARPNTTFQQAPQLLRALYEKWRNDPSFDNALEVVDSAVFVEDPFLAIGPAKMLLDDPRTMPATRAVAELIVEGSVEINIESSFDEIIIGKVSARIRRLKSRLSAEPRNGLLWLERARLHTLIGDSNSSELCLRRALGAAPNNRFVLRAYARYLVHFGRPDKAHALLKRSSRTAHDPWLQATEIAIAEAAGKQPASVRAARNVLQRQHLTPSHLTEVAAALGSLEAGSGRNKIAMRLFRQSLIQPNDNALSQAFWARDEMSLAIPIKNTMLSIAGAFEARVQAAMAEHRWGSAVENCMKWLQDEPFSQRAAVAGSFIASCYLWDQPLAISFCNRGLVANPHDRILLNNKAVSLSRVGHYANATVILDKIRSYAVGPAPDPVIMATMGLLAFRQKNILEGRDWYMRALEKAKERGQTDLQFRIGFHWFYEEARSGTLPRHSLAELSDRIDVNSKLPDIRAASVTLWEAMKQRIYEKQFGQQSVFDFPGPQLDLPLPDLRTQ